MDDHIETDALRRLCSRSALQRHGADRLGRYDVSATAPGYTPWHSHVLVENGSHVVVEVPLLEKVPVAPEVAASPAPEPAPWARTEAPSPPPEESRPAGVQGGEEVAVRATADPDHASHDLGVALRADVDATGAGGAVSGILIVRMGNRVDLLGGGFYGGHSGVFGGLQLGLLTGRLRPYVSAGVQVYFADSPVVAGRGAAGVEIDLGRPGLFADGGPQVLLSSSDELRQLFFTLGGGAAVWF